MFVFEYSLQTRTHLGCTHMFTLAQKGQTQATVYCFQHPLLRLDGPQHMSMISPASVIMSVCVYSQNNLKTYFLKTHQLPSVDFTPQIIMYARMCLTGFHSSSVICKMSDSSLKCYSSEVCSTKVCVCIVSHHNDFISIFYY